MLKPYSTKNGGSLKVEHVAFVEGRGNLIIQYSTDKASTVGKDINKILIPSEVRL